MSDIDSSIVLRPATPADLPVLTPLYMTAFADPLSLRCFPRTPTTFAWWSAMNEAEFPAATSHYLVLEDAAMPAARSATTDPRRILAYTKWNGPQRSASGDALAPGGGDDPDEMPVWPEDGDHGLAAEFFGHLAQRRRAIMGSRPHWYLEIVATRPPFRGRGLAGRLIRWGVEKADADGIEAYVEAGPELVAYYAKFGFEAVETFEPTALEGHVETLMVRQPRTSA